MSTEGGQFLHLACHGVARPLAPPAVTPLLLHLWYLQTKICAFCRTEIGAALIETSSKTGHNVQRLFQMITDDFTSNPANAANLAKVAGMFVLQFSFVKIIKASQQLHINCPLSHIQHPRRKLQIFENLRKSRFWP